MNRRIENIVIAIILAASLLTLCIVLARLKNERDAARAEVVDLRAQLAEVQETKVVVEPPADMTAVNEAYTPTESTVQTTTYHGQTVELVPASESLGMTSLGGFTVTHYCTCVQCCGKSNGITASGRAAVPYYSIAVDPSMIPLGTTVWLDYGDGVLHEARADDTGGAVRGNVLDLCVGDHATAVQMGRRSATVYVGGRNDG